MTSNTNARSCYLAALGACLFVSTSHAATIHVNTPFDIVGPLNTLTQRCINQMPANQCSLRDAATLSSLLAGNDTVILSATTYVLLNGELKFTGDVILQGKGPGSTIIMNAPAKRNRILNFASAKTVTVKNLTVTQGVLENFEAPPYNVFEGGAGIKAKNVHQFNVSNLFIYDNKIVKRKGAWPMGMQPSDACASSALHVEGGNLLLDNTWIASNDVVFDNKNLPAAVWSTCVVYASNHGGEISVQRSAIEDNDFEHVLGYDYGNEIIFRSNDIHISKTLFRNNDAKTIISSQDHSNQSMVIIERVTFENTDGTFGTVSLHPKGNLFHLSESTFEETPLMIVNQGVIGENTGNLGKNIVVNNTFKLTEWSGQLSNGVNKAIAVVMPAGVNEPFNSFRTTLLTHNTISFRAPILEPGYWPNYNDTTGVFVSAPTALQNNIIHAHAEPGFMFKVYPCAVQKPNQIDEPLASWGGNLIYSPDLNPNIPSTLNCALSPNDLLPADPLLDVLKYNGSSTKTMALKPGSPALSTAPEPIGTAVPNDQRGKPRPLGTGRDVGAYESDGGPRPEH